MSLTRDYDTEASNIVEIGENIDVKDPKKIKKIGSRFRGSIKKITDNWSKKQKRALLLIFGVIVVAIAALLLVFYFTSPVHITKVETILALSSRSENPPVQREFAINDPVMLYFEYSGAKVDSTVDFEVKNSEGEIVRNGSTTVLRKTGDDKADGKRYASIVNTPSTALSVGKYRITLLCDGREVGSINFDIKN